MHWRCNSQCCGSRCSCTFKRLRFSQVLGSGPRYVKRSGLELQLLLLVPPVEEASVCNLTIRLVNRRRSLLPASQSRRLSAGQLESGPSTSHQLGRLYKTFRARSHMTAPAEDSKLMLFPSPPHLDCCTSLRQWHRSTKKRKNKKKYIEIKSLTRSG